MRLNSLCVKDPKSAETTPPHQLAIHPTSSFAFESVESAVHAFENPMDKHLYSRFGNPTVDAVAQKIADLETYDTGFEDGWGVMTSSGMSAISTLIFGTLKKGDKILSQANLYGGTTEIIQNFLPRYGIDIVWTDLTDSDKVSELLTKDAQIKMIYFETPSNPALDCIDLSAIAAIGRTHKVLTAVDNSFCSPVIQQPLKHGIDYVVHSTTKYLNGHGNGISGIIVGTGLDRKKTIWGAMKMVGTNCNPWDAWLTNTGMKTLELRMREHSANAQALAEFLSQHDQVESVNYLGLTDHPYHTLAARQMRYFGGMMCFEVKGGVETGIRFMNTQTMGTLAPTMGDVDTLMMHPASMSHRSIDREIRLAHGIGDGLIRVSVGIEDVQDLIENFDKALIQS